MIIWDHSDSKKSSNSDDEQANICFMVDTDEKFEVKTCYESDISYSTSSNDEEDIPYDVLQNYHHFHLVQKI